MMEVEKKFKPTEDQLQKMLDGAKFIEEIILHDIYYDYPDYRLLKKSVRLRNRNGNFELKIGRGNGVAEEIENKKQIEKYFDIDYDLEDFIKSNLVVIIEYSNRRKGYLKDGFDIGLDQMDFDYSMCEIELMVDKEEEIADAERKILDFANQYGLEEKKMYSKRREYLRRFKPEIYKEVFRGDE